MASPRKWCMRGEHFVPLSGFARNRCRTDGLDFYCKACNRAWHREHAKTRRRKASRRAWAASAGRAAVNRYRGRYPQKHQAQLQLQVAVKTGKIRRASACIKCGGTKLVEAHHDDYAKPLAVRWLCRWCHRTWHRLNGQGLNANSGIL